MNTIAAAGVVLWIIKVIGFDIIGRGFRVRCVVCRVVVVFVVVLCCLLCCSLWCSCVVRGVFYFVVFLAVVRVFSLVFVLFMACNYPLLW